MTCSFTPAGISRKTLNKRVDKVSNDENRGVITSLEFMEMYNTYTYGEFRCFRNKIPPHKVAQLAINPKNFSNQSA